MNNILASCLAVVKSFSPNQVLKIPDVKVGIAKCSTAPKSDRTSIATNIRDATIEGLAIGNATLKNIKKIAKTGIDRISVGVITHSAKSFDSTLLFI